MDALTETNYEYSRTVVRVIRNNDDGYSDNDI
jgi:hypothetical protein